MKNNNTATDRSQACAMDSATSVVQPDLKQAELHLEMLGISIRDARLRFISPQEKGACKSPYSRNTISDWQARGYNAYLVINLGGDRKNEIRECTAIFFEHDDLNKSLQMGLWKSLGLPQPTFQVDTGGTSIHSYWVFDARISPEEWVILQSDLIRLANSDKACKDLSRVMRLAGSVYYDKITCQPTGRAEIVSNCGTRYSYEELRAIIPTSGNGLQPAPAPELANQNDNSSLTAIIDQIKTQTSINDFDLYDHNFIQVSNEKWQGDCPWHSSKSKRAFYINRSEGILKWYCPACEEGGTLIDYYHKIKYGIGADAKGQDFVNTVAEIAPRFNLKVERLSKTKANNNASPNQAPLGDATGKKKRTIYDLDEIMQSFTEKYRNLRFVTKHKCFYSYTGKYWEKKEDYDILRLVRGFLKSENYRLTRVSYIFEIVKVLKLDLAGEIDFNSNYLGFDDGVLDLTNFRFYSHNSSFGNTFILPRKYLTNLSETPVIDKFLDDLTGSNQKLIKVILAFMAATIRRMNTCQKFLHLLGYAGSGKGTLLRLLSALVGNENSYSSNLSSIESSNFETSNLIHKLLTIFPDEHKVSGNLSRFLSLTGGDSIKIEQKYKESYAESYQGMVAIASNYEVFVSDAMDAVQRRRILINCNYRPSRPDPYLDLKLQAELPALTKRLLAISESEILETLMTKNINQEGNWESRIANNGVAAWLNEFIIFDPDAKTLVGRNKDECLVKGAIPKTLYGSYGAFCRGAGYQIRSLNNFSNDIILTAKTFFGVDVIKSRGNSGVFLIGVKIAHPGDKQNISNLGDNLNSEILDSPKWCSPEVQANVDSSVDLKSLQDKDSVESVDLSKKKDKSLISDVLPYTISDPPSPGDASPLADDKKNTLTNRKKQSFSERSTLLAQPVQNKGFKSTLETALETTLETTLPTTRLLNEYSHLSEGSRITYKSKTGLVIKCVVDDIGCLKIFEVSFDDGSDLSPYPGECEKISD